MEPGEVEGALLIICNTSTLIHFFHCQNIFVHRTSTLNEIYFTQKFLHKNLLEEKKTRITVETKWMRVLPYLLAISS